MERQLSVFAASAFIVAAVLTSAWVTGQFTTPALGGAAGYVSELAARDQPWTRLFRATDALAGLACLLGVALAPRTDGEGAGWLLLAVFAVLTIAGAALPLDCAVLSDPSCAHRARSLAHHVHAVAGVPSAACGVAAMVLLSLRWHTWPAALLAGASLGASVLTAAAGVLVVPFLVLAPGAAPAALTLASGAASALTLAPGAAPAVLGLPPGAGVVQRVQVALLAGWLVYAGLRLLLSAPPGQVPEAGPAPGYGAGAGPAVILTSGLGGAWLSWERLAGAPARGRRVIRFDRPGLGAAPASSVPPTLYGEAARLAALAPAHPERVTVVAHGQAAWHAEAFARLHPLRVAGLVLVDPAPVAPGARGPSEPVREAARWLPALGGTWGAAALAELAAPVLARLYAPVSPVRPGAGGLGRTAAAVAGEWLARRDMAAGLRRLRAGRPMPAVPVVVVSTSRRRSRGERVAAPLRAELVRVPRRVLLRDPAALTTLA
ncbi:alpha/beta fold hydrolase [Nonomuraea sp. NPDC050383]|uniref:alpha/beta fold hydrolase n=1 Tax=Nonomuraea sp. NPDC050383 TaxID=3364362 RepID=UPI0037A2FCCE